MLTIAQARAFFQKLCNFTDNGMEIEWPMFTASMGENPGYTKREIAEYAPVLLFRYLYVRHSPGGEDVLHGQSSFLVFVLFHVKQVCYFFLMISRTRNQP